MTTKVTCPDCGGVIGVPGAGEYVCTCNQMGSSNTDTDNVGVPINAFPESKVCRVCGKNVVGHRRVKDSRGYMCYACMKQERAREIEGTVKCPQCKRRIKPGGMVPFGGHEICRKCYDYHKEVNTKKVKPISLRSFDLVERRNAMILGGIFLVLFLIVVYAHFFKK